MSGNTAWPPDALSKETGFYVFIAKGATDMRDDQESADNDIVIPSVKLGEGIRDKDTRIRAIRDLVRLNPNKILRIKDFKQASQASNAAYYIKDLMEAGYLIRITVKDGHKGHRNKYAWVDRPSGPQIDFDLETYKRIVMLAALWKEETAGEPDQTTLANKHLGVTQFVKWVHEREKQKYEGTEHDGGPSQHN